jgi:hypothetical protein
MILRMISFLKGSLSLPCYIYTSHYILFLCSFHLPVNHPDLLRRLLLGECPFLDEGRCEGLSL